MNVSRKFRFTISKIEVFAQDYSIYKGYTTRPTFMLVIYTKYNKNRMEIDGVSKPLTILP